MGDLERFKNLMDDILKRVIQKNDESNNNESKSEVLYLKDNNEILKNENNALKEEIKKLQYDADNKLNKSSSAETKNNESKSDEGSENINNLKSEIIFLRNKVSGITALENENILLNEKLKQFKNKYDECIGQKNITDDMYQNLKEQLSKKSTPDSKLSDEKLQAENKALREEISRLKKSNPSSSNNSNNSNPSNNIIMVNKPPMVYENDDRFSDYIFRNPRAEKNTYIKENVGEFLNKLFNSDEK